jgi:hypothetical protein
MSGKTGKGAKRRSRKKRGTPRCLVCDQEMTKPGGYAGTGLCGPCATGEAATLDEYGETW